MDIRAGRDATPTKQKAPRTVRDQMKSLDQAGEMMRNVRDEARPVKAAGKRRISKRSTARRGAKRRS